MPSRPSSSGSRRVRLRLEELEPRQLLSGFVPTATEQLFLEQLNDARANPAAYGASIGLDLSYVAPSQPLAFDPLLIEAARQHSQDMNDHAYFDHTSSSGQDPGQRLTSLGFPWSSWGESIAGGSVYAGPADALKALIIDNGVPSLGHRNQLLAIEPMFQTQEQVGIGVVQNGTGPLQNYYTVDTAATFDTRPFLTGVVFNDANGNGKYDIGEGLGGVTITISGGGSTTTFDSGGYSLQLNPGTYTVTASGGGLAAPITRNVTLGNQNVRDNFIATASSSSKIPPPVPLPGPNTVSTITDASGNQVEFLVGTDYSVYRHDQAGWTQIAGPWSAQSVSASTENGQAVVFAISLNHGLLRRDSQSGWNLILGPGTTTSISTATDNGHAEVYAVANDHSLWRYDYPTGLVQLAGPWTTTSVSAVTEASGHPVVFAVTSTYQLLRSDNQVSWNQILGPWTTLSISTATDNGQAQVFAVTGDHQLLRDDYSSGLVQLATPWSTLSAAAGTDSSGHSLVYVLTGDHQLLLRTYLSGWNRIAGPWQVSCVEEVAPASGQAAVYAFWNQNLLTFSALVGWIQDPTLS